MAAPQTFDFSWCFYPNRQLILTRRSNVVYLQSVEEWLPCLPGVVSSLCRRGWHDTGPNRIRETPKAHNRRQAEQQSGQAFFQPVEKDCLRQVDPDEDHFAFACLSLGPSWAEIVAYQAVHSLKDYLAVSSLDAQHSLIT